MSGPFTVEHVAYVAPRSFDLAVGLNVPVRVLIHETPAGEVRFEYDKPSNPMSHLGDAEITAAAEKLDAKLAALAEQATGARA